MPCWRGSSFEIGIACEKKESGQHVDSEMEPCVRPLCICTITVEQDAIPVFDMVEDKYHEKVNETD